MEAVIKIGGSLQRDPATLRKLCGALSRMAKKHGLLVVPGGGVLAELVRRAQAKFKFSDRVAHLLAIQAMEVYGFILHSMIQGSVLSSSLTRGRLGKCRIFLPLKTLKDSSDLKPSWRVTSDSIAAWVSWRVGCRKLLLIKAVDGISVGGRLRDLITTPELRKLKQTVVDPSLPEILERGGVGCWVVNGKYPERIQGVLESKKAVCTLISPVVE